ncbi:MAG TPA: autotransporter-associated beta strand repeat-containing protein [Tepidisphaeraceae bacterium]|nr:autotransporter-associated beta strand repeat-containing protein [Tepidisphaeraceae bacterium]
MSDQRGSAARQASRRQRFLGNDRGRVAIMLAAGLTAAAATGARAADLTWDILPGDAEITNGSGTWTDGGGNWNNGADATWSSANPDGASFGLLGGGGNGTAGTVTVTGAVSAAYIDFQIGVVGGSYLLTGGTIDIGAGGIGANAAGTIESTLSGTSGLTKIGAQVLTLTGANTYSGDTVVNAGTLAINGNGALGAAGNNVVLGGGGLRLLGALTSARNVTLTATGAIDTNGFDATLSGALSGAGGLNKNGTGTLVLNGSNTYSGLTTVAAGTLTINGANATSGVTFNGGAQVNVGHAAALGSGVITFNGGTLDNTTGSALTLANAVSWTNNPNFGGSNDFTFTNTAGISADIQRTINIGGTGRTIRFDSVLSNTNAGNRTLTVNGAGNTLILGGLNFGPDATNRTVTINGSANVSFTGALANGGTATAAPFNWGSTGTLRMSGANTYGGATNLGGGTVILDYSAQNNSKLADATALTIGGSVNLVLSGGSHTEIVSATTLNPGALKLTRPSGTGTLRMNAITNNVGGIANIGAAGLADTDSTNTNGILSLGSRAVITVAGSDWGINSTNAADGPITAYSAYTTTAEATWAAANNVAVTDSATLTAARTINTIKLTNTGAGQSLNLGGQVLTLNAGGILFTGASDYSIGSGTIRGGQASASDVVVHNYGTGALNITAPIVNNAGASRLTVGGTGTTVFAAPSTYTGQTWVVDGTSKVGVSTIAGTSGAFGNGNGTLTVAQGAVVDLNGFNLGVGGLTTAASNLSGSTGTVLNNSGSGTATLTVGNNNAGFGSAVLIADRTTGSGTVAVVKTGTGQWQVNNANTYTGGTTITGGTARLENDAALGTGTITLASTAALASASRNIYVTRNATLANNIVVQAGTQNAIEVSINNAGLTFNGSLSTTGTSANPTVLRLGTGFDNPNFNFNGDMSGFAGTLSLAGNNAGSNSANSRYNFTNTATPGAPNAHVTLAPLGAGNANHVRLMWNPATATSATIPIGALSSTLTGSQVSAQAIVGNARAGTTATYAIGGLNTSTSFGGIIRNDHPTSGGGITALTKVGTGTLTLSGVNLYTGPTNVNAGKLNITGSLDNTVVTVNGGGALGGAGGAIAGPVTVAGGSAPAARGAIDLLDSQIATLTLNNGLTLGGAAGQSSNLYFEAGNNANASDLLNIATGALTLNSGGATIYVTNFGNLTSGAPYTLMTFPSATGLTTGTGTTVGNLTLDPSVNFGPFTAKLQVDATSVKLIIEGGGAAPTVAYWTGGVSNAWNGFSSANGGTFNFATSSAGGTSVSGFVGATTDVIFTANTASNLATTLGQNTSIKSLTITGAGPSAATPVSIAGTATGANTLSIGDGGITVASGAAGLNISTTGLILEGNQTWTNNSATPMTVSSNIGEGSPLRSLTYAGTGAFVVSGNSIYTGGTTISSGSVTLGSATALGAVTGNLAVNGGTLNLNGNNVTVASFSGSAPAAVVTNNSATTAATLSTSNASDVTYAGAINNGSAGQTVALIKNGAGVLTLSNASTYSGGTTLGAGTIRLGTGTSLGTGGVTINASAASTPSNTLDLNGQTIANVLTINGGATNATILNNSTTAAAVTSTITNPGNFTIDGTGDLTLGNVSRNVAFTITKNGTGTTTFGGALDNAFMSVVVNAGTVVADKDTAVVASGAHALNNVTINSGATVKFGLHTTTGGFNPPSGQINNAILAGGTLDMNGAGGVNGTLTSLTGSGTVTNSSATAATVGIGGNGNSGTFGGVIQDGTGTVAVNKVGGGTVRFTTTNTYSGGTTFSGGNFDFTTVNELGTGGFTFNGGTLRYNGNTDDISARTVTFTGNGTIDTNGMNVTFANPIGNNGAGGLTKTGAGTLTLPAANTFTGVSGVNNGTLLLTHASALGQASVSGQTATGNFVFDASVGSHHFTFGGLSGAGTINLVDNAANTVSITVGGNNLSPAAHTGTITGAGSLTKAGTGTTTVNGTLTHTGSTTVNAGNLNLGTNLTTSSGIAITGGALRRSATAAADGVIKAPTLSITGGGQLDLVNNKLIVNNAAGSHTVSGTTYGGVAGLVQSGYAGGAWTGTGIVTSHADAAPAAHLTSLAVASASELNRVGQTFGGQVLAAGDMIVLYTYGGDANLDRKLNGDDYFQIDSYVNAPGASGWTKGDFDYNGKINGDDYFILDSNIGRQSAAAIPVGQPLGGGIADSAAAAGGIDGGVTAVPEPASLGVLLTATCGLLARRRRRSLR